MPDTNKFLASEFHWDETKHPRGQPRNRGQFVEGGGGTATMEPPAVEAEPERDFPGLDEIQSSIKSGAKAKLIGLLKASAAPLETKYGTYLPMRLEAFEHVVDSMEAKAAGRAARAVKSIKMFRDTQELTESLGKQYEFNKKEVGGCYTTDSGMLSLDGNAGFMDMANIYAHELTHALDWDATYRDETNRFVKGRWTYSWSPEWKEAYVAEINPHYGEAFDKTGWEPPLSLYAATDLTEGFAEFGRLAILKPSEAKAKFPRCWQFWKDEGLVR